MIDPKLCFSATNEIVKISKDIAEDKDIEEELDIGGEIEEFPEKVFDTETQPLDQPVHIDRDSSDIIENPSEKKISLSIEKLRKMVDEQDK